MDQFVAQKADQALQELLTDLPLARRIRVALMHLSHVTNDHYIEGCPPVVQDALRKARGCEATTDLGEQGRVVYTAISRILEAWGHQKVKQKL